MLNALFSTSKSGSTVTLPEIRAAFNQLKIHVPSGEFENAFLAYDEDHDGRLEIYSFVKSILGAMTIERLELIKNAYKKILESANSPLKLAAIKALYIAKNHPAVLENRKTAEIVIQDFEESFQMLHKKVFVAKESIEEDEFIEYYQYVSAAVESQEYFSTLIHNVWGLSADKPLMLTSPIKTSLCGPHEEKQLQLVNMEKIAVFNNIIKLHEGKNEGDNLEVFLKFREIMFTRGVAALLSLIRQLRIADKQKKGGIDCIDFMAIMESIKTGLSEKETAIIRKIFESPDMRVSIDDFYHTIVGEISPQRTQLIEDSYKQLDKVNSGYIDQGLLTKQYSSVTQTLLTNKSGAKLSTDDIIYALLDNLDKFTSIVCCRKKDGRILRDEFSSYYALISSMIEDDLQFESMMVTLWKITSVLGKTAKEEYERKKKEAPKVVEPPKPLVIEEPDHISILKAKIAKRGIRGVFGMVNGLKAYNEGNEYIAPIAFAKFLIGYHYCSKSEAEDIANKFVQSEMTLFDLMSNLYGDLNQGRAVLEELFNLIKKEKIGVDELKAMVDTDLIDINEYVDILEGYSVSRNNTERMFDRDLFVAFHILYTIEWTDDKRRKLLKLN